MRYTILTGIICFFLASCNKDKFSTRPQLTFKSVNTEVVSKPSIFKMTLSFTDAEGDIEDSLFIFKVTRNCPQSDIDLKYKIPPFPLKKNLQGDIEVTYAYGTLSAPAIPGPLCSGVNDTCIFRFVLRDKALNKSDTVNSPTIVIVQ